MPKFDWSKVIGSKKLGASFGMKMENFVDLSLEPFKGNFELKVDNLAFAEVNVGLIGMKFDIFRVSLCYKKKFKYNLNVLKDFGFDDIQNLASAFDKMFHKIIDPIVDAVKTVRELIEMVKDMTFVQLVKNIIDLFKNLPSIIIEVVDKIKETYKKLTDFDGFPLINKFKALVNRIVTFISDIKSDVMEFYHSIADAMTVTLPFVGHEMAEGFQLIKDSWKFWENPMESFKGIEMALLKFKLAVGVFIEAKHRIMDACFFAKGRTPYWFHPGEVIHGIFNDLNEVLRLTFEEFKDVIHVPHSSAVEELSPMSFVGSTDGFNISGTHNSIKLVLHEAVAVLEEKLNGTLNIAEPFWKQISHLMEMFKKIKNAYEVVRDVIHKGKYYIQKIFGAKFHRKFPKIPAPCESSDCGCGELRKDDKGRLGVHLNFKPTYQKVVNPFHGTIYRKSDSEVLVRPVRADVAMYEVVVSGFNVDAKVDDEGKGMFKRAGRVIGRAKDAGDCHAGNFLFVAMRKRPNSTEVEKTMSEDSYFYIDPTPYLKRRFPKPGYNPSCNGFSYYYIGMTADEGSMTGDAEDSHEDIHRSSEGSKSHPFGDKHHSGHHGRHGRSADLMEEEPEKKSWMLKFKEKFHNMTGKFDKYKNMVSKISKSFLPQFDLNDKSLTFISQLLMGSPLLHDLDDIAKQVAEKLRTEPLGYPDELPLHQIRRRLKKAHEFDTVTGDRLTMIDRLMDIAVEDCPSFNESIVRGYGHYCEAHEDCHGITCSIGFREGFQRHIFKVDLRAALCEMKIYLSVHGVTKDFSLKSQKDIMVVEVSKRQNKELVFDIEIEVNDETITITLSGALCVTTHYSCFEDVEIFQTLLFNGSSWLDCGKGHQTDPYLDHVYSMTLPDLLEEVSEFGMDMHKCLIIVNEIRNATLYALMTKESNEEIEGDGFPGKEDFCFESGVIPFDVPDIEIINPGPVGVPPFPGINFLFMVGPIPLRLSFGATAKIGLDLELGMCLMSMKAKAMVTPHIGAGVWGELAVDIGIAYGGIRLEGVLLETRFPITAEFGFSKFPIKIGFKLDLVIIPLELRLKAFARLRLLFITVTVFDACIWKFKLPAYKINLFTIPFEKRDPNPPKIATTSSSPRERRSLSGPGGCEVKQLEGRDLTDTAFLLEVTAKSDVSDITLSYAIGTHSSGTDVQGWTGMTGSSITAPVKFKEEHHGRKIFWSVKAKNSQGDEVVTVCSLNTFDNTVPDGRIDQSYPYTSHTHMISGNVVVFDDSELLETHSEAVGTSEGQMGADVVPWQTLILKSTTVREDADPNSPLKFFTLGKEGKLTSREISSSKTDKLEGCAQMCLNSERKCLSFDYEYHSETCDIHSVVEGPKAGVRLSGTYKHYERLGVGYSSFIEHNIDLQHGTVYILNAEITNTLGYRGYVSSNGTMVDHTPPEPGPIESPSLDVVKFDGCKAAITQRCVEQTNIPNHRKIIDGPGSRTVFNGHKGGVDTLYTLANHFISGNWDGFRDNETGIFGYTWSVGTTLCGTDIADFSDPHAHLSSPKFWTNTGYARNLHLPDGQYYITVQALNNVVHGGAMVTTVCHTTPFTMDTTPPIFTRGITDDDIVFDEDFNMMALYFDTKDERSNVKKIDFGLGLTKHDVDVRGYSAFPYKENKSYIVVDDLNLASGEPVWIRLRSVNHVDLFITAHSDNPILIDRTSPVAGQVLDGDSMDHDLQYQSDDTKICAQWTGFYDPESGINEYRWGVGTRPDTDDIVSYITYSRDTRESCATVQLNHNQTYFSSVRAKNSALNPKTVKGFSNGVMIDTTPPVQGWIVDGSAGRGHDIAYSSETAEVSAMWGGFSDPESGIISYTLEVYINNRLVQSFDNGIKTEFVDYSLSMKHGDHVYVKLTAKNGADATTVVQSDGFVIDQTPPIVQYLYDTQNGLNYQSNAAQLHFKWKFEDQESGMKEYRYYVEDFFLGQGTKFHPQNKEYITIPVVNGNNAADIVLSNLNLQTGHKYSVKVTALNHAGMPTVLQSKGVMIDSKPPVLDKVHLGIQSVPEEINEGFIEHDDQHSMTLTWKAYDYESGIIKSFVAIGTFYGDTSVTNGFLEFGSEPKAVLKDLTLKPATEDDPEYYYVMVKVQNGAGLFSEVKNLSRPIKVLKENIPGTVFDGRIDLEDSDFTYDRTSLAMSFVGFESEQCNIVGYEWSIGSQPFYYDILPFTRYGIVLVNDTHGRAQIHLPLYEGSTYYITVRAQTGHRCKEEYILSCSDGITLDTTPPTIKMVSFGKQSINPELITTSLYQNRTDSLDFRWESLDASGIESNWWSIGSSPGQHNIHPVTVTEDNYIPAGSVKFKHGQTFFLNTGAMDKAGNRHVVTSPPITIDTTIPEILDLECTPYISVFKSLVQCKWGMIKEYESSIKNFTVGVGSEETTTDISQFHKQSIFKRTWTRDLLTRVKNNNLTAIYIIFKLENVLGMTKKVPFKVVVDRTAPIGGKVDIVTTIDLNVPIIKQDCQIPGSFVEFVVNGWQDEESEIERYEAAIGFGGRITNIKDFTSVTVKDKVLIKDLSFTDDSDVRITVRAFNKAGLYAQVTSDPVIVSYKPKLSVNDGISNEDENYQTSLNVIQGHWQYSDRCKIISAEWAVEDLAGNVLQEFTPLPGAKNRFYSDILKLINGRTYINIIRTVDALNRTRTSRSNGIAVKIEPPLPGDVRDGETEDLNYQESIHELYVNWDMFGDKKSRDPTQQIQRYEVAIGTDRRYVNTRNNIHIYIDVGLNTSHVFKNLNLTAKTVTYFMTVRAYSFAGSYQEVSSNGVKVGYHDAILPGVVEHSRVQSYTDKIFVSWRGFQADMGIDSFRVGVSSIEPANLPNETLSCRLFDENLPVFDIADLHDVGLDTFTEITNLTLLHGREYYVTVIATDATQSCMGSYGHPIMVDTTPPVPGKLHLPGGTGPNVAFVFDPKRLELSWTEFEDPESRVVNYEVKIFSGMTCTDSGEIPQVEFGEPYSLIKSTDVNNDLKTEFYDLSLSSTLTYVLTVSAVNEAGLKTTVRSPPIRLDTTPPYPGSVKMGLDWKSDISFQSDVSTMRGMVAIAHTSKAFSCPRQVQVFPAGKGHIEIEDLGLDFQTECVVIKKDQISLFIRHDDQLQKLIKGGIKLSEERILEGNYTTVLKVASGDQMITSWFLASSFDGILSEIEFKLPENDTFDEMKGFDKLKTDPLSTELPSTTMFQTESDSVELSEMTTEYSLINRTDSLLSNGTETYQGTTNASPTSTLATTTEMTTKGHMKTALNASNQDPSTELTDQYGVGFHIPGYQLNGKWYAFIWMQDKYKQVTRQVELKFDPTVTFAEFIVNLEKVVTPVTMTWAVNVYLNGETIAQFNGLILQEEGVTGIYTWNKENYFPPVVDVLDPYIGEAVILDIGVPLPITEDMKCAYGAAFYDGESQVKELWVGISDTKNSTDSIYPMSLYKTFCNPCPPGCNIGCDKSCGEKHPDDFQILDIIVRNLSLEATKVDLTETAGDNQFNASTYYYNVMAVNYAGQETLVRSKAVMVDPTPPDLQYVRCVDPSNSMDEPSEYQGTNSSMGAYWECSEDVGDIVGYQIQIGSKPGLSDIKSSVSVGLTKKLEVDGLLGKLLHDHTYYFTVTVKNSAGLVSWGSCNITVEILPPDVSNVTLTYLYSDQVVDETVLTTEDKNIGLEWNGGKEDVAFYEWAIGSEPGTDDVFPRIKVGVTESRKAFIEDGKLWIDEIPLNKSVGEFANKSWSNETVLAAKTDTFFALEPGKCVYVTLYAVGRSHLSSTVKSDPLCVKRSQDVDLTLQPPSDKRKRVSNRQHGLLKLQDSKTDLSADVIVKGTNITMLGGVLTETDVTSDYGTAASDRYNRYLTDPLSGWNDTTRLLKNRLKDYAGLMFFLSPSTSVESLREINIDVKFDVTQFDSNIDIPALIYWDNVEQLWKLPGDICNDKNENADFGNSIFSTKICKEVFHKSTKEDSMTRRKRSAPSHISVPRMWALMRISRRAPNTPPRVTTYELFITEDTDDIQNVNGVNVIEYEDDEMDTVEFSVIETRHGVSNVTSTGEIHFTPLKDFNGVDYVIVKVVETGLHPPFHPLSTTKNITIHVAPANDAPEVLPFESDLEFEEVDMPGRGTKEVSMLLEGNTTRTYNLGHLTFYDVDFIDPNENEINYTTRMNNTVLHNFTFHSLDEYSLHKKKYRLSLSVDKKFFGKITFQVRGFDQAKFTTKNVEVNVYILLSPCIHGTCLNSTSTSCEDKERAFSFDKYRCDCYLGYTDEWCQTDINECQPNPCSVFYDCEDLIGYQKCNLNVVKTILLTFAVALTLVMCFVLVRRWYKKKRPNKIDPGRNTWSFGTEHLGQVKGKKFRPSTAKSTSSTEDLIQPSTSHDRPTTAGEINVGIDGIVSKEGPKRIWMFSEKTMDNLNKTLEPVSEMTMKIGQRAPHHQQILSKLDNSKILSSEGNSKGDMSGPAKERKLPPLKTTGVTEKSSDA